MERLVRWIATPVDHVPLIEAPLTQVQEKATVASIADPNDGLLMAAIAAHGGGVAIQWGVGARQTPSANKESH